MIEERPHRNYVLWVVWAGLALGAALRIWIFFNSRLGALDQDESIVGLMARHFAQGEMTPFFWGQPYGGTLGLLIGGGLFTFIPPSATVLRLIAVGYHALGAFLTWRIGLRLFSRRVAAIAAVLVWAWPTYAVWRSVRAHAFYGPGLVLSLLVILLVLRIRDDQRPLDIAALGLAAGLGWWTSGQTILIVVPAVGWLIWKRPDVLRKLPIAIIPAIAGAMPWLWPNLIGDSDASVVLATADSPTQYFEWLRGIFVQPLPAALGARIPGSTDWLVGPAVGIAIYVVLLMGLAWSWHRRSGDESLLWAIALAYPFLLAVSEFSEYRAEPRYLYFLMPILALLLARLTDHLPGRMGLGVPVFLLLLSVAGLWVMSRFPEDQIVPADFTPVVVALEEHDVEHGFAYHTIAYRLTFESQEQIIVSPIDHIRYWPYDEAVRASQRPAYIFAPSPDVTSDFERTLDQAGVDYTTVRAGDFTVFLPAARVLPEEVPALHDD